MSVKIKLKHSSTAGKVPTAGDLDAGEVALNTSDVKAYIKNAGGAVVQLAGSGADATKVDKAGDTMTGALVLPAAAPTADDEAANKKYVDDQVALAVAKTGDTMTGDLDLPNLSATGFASVLGGSYSRTGDADGHLFIGQKTDFTKVFTVSNDGDVAAAGDVQMASLNSGPLAGLRNQIINGDFRVWQRGTTRSISAYEYTADRWMVPTNSPTTISRSGAVPENKGLTYSLESTANTNSVHQGIELNTAGKAGQFRTGSTWTLSFWANANVTSLNTQLRFRDQVGYSTNEVTAATPPNYTETGETGSGSGFDFKRYKTTFTITGSPAASNVCLDIYLPGFNVVSGVARLFITGVQLEPGPVATPFEHRPIGLELSLCQRYYQTVGRLYMYPYSSASGSANLRRYEVPRTVVMRRSPDESGSANNAIGGTIDFGSFAERIYAGVANTDGDNATTIINYAADAEL